MAARTRKEAIVMDVDQVLLDYYSRLREYVNRRYGRQIVGLPEDWDMTPWLQCSDKDDMLKVMTEFSESWEFGTLDAYPGADVVLHELLREGYALVCLTACGSHDVTQALRKANLFHRFGDIFEEIHFVNFTEGKSEKMKLIEEKYDIIAFVDDKPSNIEDIYYGNEVDHCILMKAPHNREWRLTKENLNVDYAFGWYECKQFINKYSEEV